MKKRKNQIINGVLLFALVLNFFSVAKVEATPNQEIQVAVISEAPYTDLYDEDDGKISGYLYELLCEIGQLTGYSYEFVYCTRQEAYEGLNNHRFDLVCGLSEEDIQNHDLCRSSLPVGWYPNVLYGKNNEIADGSVVGALTENQSEISYTKMNYADRASALEALSNDTVQAVILPGYDAPEGCVKIRQVDVEFFYLAAGENETELMEVVDLAFLQLLEQEEGILERLAIRYLYEDSADLFYLTQEEQAVLNQLKSIDIVVSNEPENITTVSNALLQDLANTLDVDLMLKKDSSEMQNRQWTIVIVAMVGLGSVILAMAVSINKKNQMIKLYQSQLAEKTDVITEITKDEGLRELRYFTLNTFGERMKNGCLDLEKQFGSSIRLQELYTYPQKLVGDEGKIYQVIVGILKDIHKSNRTIKQVDLIIKELPEMVVGRLELKIQIKYPTIEDYVTTGKKARSKERTQALSMLEILGGRLLTSKQWDYTTETIFLSLEKRHYKEKEEERMKTQQEKIRQAQREHLEEQRELYKSDPQSMDENLLQSSLQGLRILLVDDDEMNLQLEKVILEKAGATIECVTNGRDAINAFRRSPEGYYDKIVMDIVMSGINGYEAARKIRSLRREDAKKIRIVALSANAADEDVREAIEAGMDAHCSKPINKNALFKALIS